MQRFRLDKSYNSPNYDERPSDIKHLVLHYTGMKSAKEALDRLCDQLSNVSAHYLIDLDGTIYSLVDEKYRAWHAGKSYWRGDEALNNSSIGIEIVNKGHEFGYHPFSEEQMKSVIYLAKDIVERHKILPINVVAHSDIAPDRKEDPGELFNWKMLADEGIGIYPLSFLDDNNPYCGDSKILKQKLQNIGYLIDINEEYDDQFKKVLIAFKRHFNPEIINDIPTQKDLSIINEILKNINI